MEQRTSVLTYTTLPRKNKTKINHISYEELHKMPLERRLSSLNISSESPPPIPPPRKARMHKSTTNPDMLRTHSREYDKMTRYEMEEKRLIKEPLCDIITSSQQNPNNPRMSPQPDLVLEATHELRSVYGRGLPYSFSEDSRLTDKYHIDGLQKPRHPRLMIRQMSSTVDNHQNIKTSDRPPQKTGAVPNGTHERATTSSVDANPAFNRSISSPGDSINSRFTFYKPPVSRSNSMLTKSRTTESLTNAGGKNGGRTTLSQSPDGSFDNPAFNEIQAPKPITSTPKTRLERRPSNKTVYSTAGAQLVAIPHVSPVPSAGNSPRVPQSPPSQRFGSRRLPRHASGDDTSPMMFSFHPAIDLEKLSISKPPSGKVPTSRPIPIKPMSLKPVQSPMKLMTSKAGPVKVPPILSAKVLEDKLKDYATHMNSDFCPSEDYSSMMRYYNMTPSPDMRRDTPTPPPGGLSKSQKNRSPYSSSGSLNISGDSIENVLRRKKKVKIRPRSFSSDDEATKRVSLEVNLTPAETSVDGVNKVDRSVQSSPTPYQEEVSRTDPDTFTERLNLDDLTSTETARLLKKQFSKLKARASNLKTKDTELKQRFLILQSKRGRICGSTGGGIYKTRNRNSWTLV